MSQAFKRGTAGDKLQKAQKKVAQTRLDKNAKIKKERQILHSVVVVVKPAPVKEPALSPFEEPLLGPEVEKADGPPQNVEDYLRDLTVPEKVAVLSGSGFFQAGGVPRLNLPSLVFTDGPHGARGFPTFDGALLTPCEMGLGATFNEALVEEIGSLLGEETLRRGAHVLLGPVLNLQRLPNSGRHFECFSEDAHLTARLGVSYIKGVQRHVGACAKHLVCNDQENHRHSYDAEVDLRTLHEVYLRPFRAAVEEAQVEGIMTAYNRVNGIFCSEDQSVMDTICRKQWGFQGWFVSDWFANRSTVEAINAGLNIEMPGLPPCYYGGSLVTAAKDGKVTEDALDERCKPVLASILKKRAEQTELVEDAARELLQRAAAESLVLLKNDGSTLPLNTHSFKKLAVIGPNAADTCVAGGGSSRVRNKRCDTILQVLQRRMSSAGVEVLHAQGSGRWEAVPEPPEAEMVKGCAQMTAAGQPDGAVGPLNFVEKRLFSMMQRHQSCLRRLGNNPKGNPDRAGELPETVSSSTPTTCTLLCKVLVLLVCSLACAFSPTSLALQPWQESSARAAAVLTGLMALGNLCSCMCLCRKACPSKLRNAAVQAVSAADVSILVLGTDGHWECEGFDQPHMMLPGQQNELAMAVLENASRQDKKVIVVLNVGSPKEMPWLDQAHAVLLAPFGGEMMASAVVDCLFGFTNPSGRLPMTWPATLEEAPAVYASQPEITWPANSQSFTYAEGLHVGFRASKDDVDPKILNFHGYEAQWEENLLDMKPLFSFGHGLSYTTFGYGNPQIRMSDSDNGLCVNVRVRNEGKLAGIEVVQLYVTTPQIPRALRGFKRTSLMVPGTHEVVQIDVSANDFADWYDVDTNSWKTLSPGTPFWLDVGSSSSCIHKRVELKIPDDDNSTSCPSC